MKLRNVSIREEADITYVNIVIFGVGVVYEFDTFEEALEALSNLEELQDE